MRIIGTILLVVGVLFMRIAAMYQGPIRPMAGAEQLLKLLNSTANLDLLGVFLAALGGCLLAIGLFKSLLATMESLRKSLYQVIGAGFVALKDTVNDNIYQQGREDLWAELRAEPSLLLAEPEAPYVEPSIQPAQMPPLRERPSVRNGGHKGVSH